MDYDVIGDVHGHAAALARRIVLDAKGDRSRAAIRGCYPPT